MDIDFDTVVVTGDHTHDERAESYAFVRELLADWSDRLLVVPGNHDDRQILQQEFADVLNRPEVLCTSETIRFHLRAAGWNLIGLDSHVPSAVPGYVSDAQCDWLNLILQEQTDTPTALFMHHPPIPVGSVWMDAIGLQQPQRFQDVIRQHPQVQLIVCGHVHHEWQGLLGATSVVTTPSTGIQFDPNGTEPAFASAAPGYRLITLSTNSWRSIVKRLPTVEFSPTNPES